MRFNTPISASTRHPKSLHYPSIASQVTSPIKPGSTNGKLGQIPRSKEDGEKTTVRIANPKFRQFNVEATDEFSAPVAKLSQWLANDPTKPKKKFLEVRKGRNVMEKSSTYEKQDTVGKKEQHIVPKGAVSDALKEWQKKESHESSPQGRKVNIETDKEPPVLLESKDQNDTDSNKSPSVTGFSDSSGAPESPFANEFTIESSVTASSITQERDVADEIQDLVDDPVPADKNGLEIHASISFESSISSQPSLARNRFAEDIFVPEDPANNRGTLILGQSSVDGNTTSTVLDSNTASTVSETTISDEVNGDTLPPDVADANTIPEENSPEDEWANPPSILSGDVREHVGSRPRQAGAGQVVVEQDAVVNNNADQPKSKTKEIAAKFGKVKGSEEKETLTAVQLRKQKIELEEKEHKRRENNPYGLMKLSWKRPHKARGLPSDAWKRTFQGNLPPKKTFAELP